VNATAWLRAGWWAAGAGHATSLILAGPPCTWTEAGDGDDGLLGAPVGVRPRAAEPTLGAGPLAAPEADSMGDVMPTPGACAVAAHDSITPAPSAGDMTAVVRHLTAHTVSGPAYHVQWLKILRKHIHDRVAGV